MKQSNMPKRGTFTNLIMCMIFVFTQAASAGEYPLAFGDPWLSDADDQAFSLTAGDFDSDGRVDLVCVDNTSGLIHFYMQTGDERLFEHREEPVESIVRWMAAGDFNHDGRVDLVLGGSPTLWREQSADGRLEAGRELEEGGVFVRGGDLNGDGKEELVVFAEQYTAIYSTLSADDLSPERTLSNIFATRGGWIGDVDGDGRNDLVTFGKQQSDVVIVRYQQDDGQFQPEQSMRTGFFFSAALTDEFGAQGVSFVTTDSRTDVLKAYRLETDEEERPLLSRPRYFAFSRDAQADRSGFDLATAPATGDSPAMLFIVPNQLPSVGIVTCESPERIEREDFPSLLGASYFKATTTNEGDRLIWLFSQEEKTIGVAQIEGREMKFPQPLTFPGAINACAMGDWDGEKGDDFCYIEIMDSRGAPKEIFRVFANVNIDDTLTTPSFKADLPILRLKSSNQHFYMQIADVNRDGHGDLIIFPEYEEPIVLIQTDAGELEVFLYSNHPILGGLLKGLKKEQWLVEDLDGDGLNEVLLAKDSFVRVMQIEPDGSIKILAQLAGKNSTSKISQVVCGELTGDSRKDILMLDVGPERLLTIYAAGDDGEWALEEHHELDDLLPTAMTCIDLTGDGRSEVILNDKRQLALMFANHVDPEFKPFATYRSEVEDGGYRQVELGDLFPTPGDELVAVENTEHLLDFFRLNEEQELERIYKFKVFGGEGDGRFYDPEKKYPPEPREIIFPDLNGDGLRDLAILVHDKLIVYLQTTAASE